MANSTPEALREFFAQADWSKTNFSERNDQLAENVLSLVGDLPGNRVLDLGCGSAMLGIELACRGFDVTGLDLWTEPARRRMAARGVTIRLIEQDMRSLAFRDEFDMVLNWDVSGIGMLGTDQENIDVVRRVHHALGPGGKFLIETYNRDSVRTTGIEGLRFDPSDGRMKGLIRGQTIALRLFSLTEWQSIFEDLDFTVLKACGSLSGEPLYDKSRMLVMVAEKQGIKEPEPA